MVVRPVEVSPVQNVFPIVDPQTGRATETFQYFLLKMWERTGGFTDDFFSLLEVSNLGQIQGLIAGAQLEALERKLGDAAALGRLSSFDRVSAEIETIDRRLNLFQALVASQRQPTQSSGLVVIDAPFDYVVNRDSPTITVYAFGGAGGGGAGSATQGGGGGGGAGFSVQTFQTAALDDVISVGVGLGGVGGTSISPDGGDGAETTFGDLLVAKGGNGGLGGSTGGPVTDAYGNLYQGGPGADGATVTPNSAVNTYPGGPGGGGGGGPADGVGGDGAAGNWRSLLADGGGGAGGLAGLPGTSPDRSDQFLAPGLGAGGGGGSTAGSGGNGGTGGLGAGGGGGGASVTDPGDGGNGGNGLMFIVENL